MRRRTLTFLEFFYPPLGLAASLLLGFQTPLQSFDLHLTFSAAALRCLGLLSFFRQSCLFLLRFLLYFDRPLLKLRRRFFQSLHLRIQLVARSRQCGHFGVRLGQLACLLPALLSVRAAQLR